jgi:hypothetical protein
MAAAAGAGLWTGQLWIGLALGSLIYVGAILALKALNQQEIAPLLRRR